MIDLWFQASYVLKRYTGKPSFPTQPSIQTLGIRCPKTNKYFALENWVTLRLKRNHWFQGKEWWLEGLVNWIHGFSFFFASCFSPRFDSDDTRSVQRFAHLYKEIDSNVILAGTYILSLHAWRCFGGMPIRHYWWATITAKRLLRGIFVCCSAYLVLVFRQVMIMYTHGLVYTLYYYPRKFRSHPCDSMDIFRNSTSLFNTFIGEKLSIHVQHLPSFAVPFLRHWISLLF